MTPVPDVPRRDPDWTGPRCSRCDRPLRDWPGCCCHRHPWGRGPSGYPIHPDDGEQLSLLEEPSGG